MTRYIFAPGCALYLYKPRLIDKLQEFLDAHYGGMERLVTCCRHTPRIPAGVCVINICPGCDRRYRENYEDPLTVSLWELLADSASFPFPDYRSREMTVIDACPTRDQDRIHEAVRALAERMNIRIVEPERTGRNGTCCGDTFFGNLPADEVRARMKAKADDMPVEDVLVYCVSCAKSMFVGGKRPRYMVDLLFGEDTVAGTYDPEEWHGELDKFIDEHRDYEVESG